MDYFSSHSLEENKSVIDKYANLIMELLKYGVYDYVHKFKNGYGLNEKGEVIFIDFNEVVFSKERTLKYINEQRWQNEAQFRKMEEGDLKDYLEMKLSECLSIQVVNNLWAKYIL